jgi:hypothetical protein
MSSIASRVRSAPTAAVVVLVALVGVLGGFLVAQLSTSYADNGVKVVQLSGKDLSSVADRTYLYTCGREFVVKPAYVSTTCGDENTGVDHLRWSGWGGAEATSQARYYENTCDPYCAAGHFLYYPAKVVAHGLERKNGKAVYTEITMIFPHHLPPYVQADGKTGLAARSSTVNVIEMAG